MLGQEGKKEQLSGAQAEKVRAALARALSNQPNECERAAEESIQKARVQYSVEWR